MTDPLAAFMTEHVKRAGHPVPLISTHFDIIIEAGLAMVETRRLFRNGEADAIEAALTFPVPVHATLHHLEAQVDGRVILDIAKARAAARKTYEDAIERGKGAALHEELLRGIHMVSLANIRPGGEILLITRWAMPLAVADGSGHLRIPLTVGHVYGCSGLSECDEMAIGGANGTATLRVTCDGAVELAGGTLTPDSEALQATVPLDRPVDLRTALWAPRPLGGMAADGRPVSLSLTPAPESDGTIDVAILLDRSGSMDTACSPESGSPTTHAAAIEGLDVLAAAMRDQDRIDLWQFDDSVDHVGAAHSCEALRNLVNRLGDPRGGTQIGRAIETVIEQSAATDILILTDGRSHALDIDRLAGRGRRISVVLIGEDSLEARIGHLAAETGGHVFIAAGHDIGAQILAAIVALRLGIEHRDPIALPLEKAAVTRNAVHLSAAWGDDSPPASQRMPGRAVAASAAAIALPMLPADTAEALAIAEGLVTHRTSLVLVDEAGATQAGLPAFRKVALPIPAVAAVWDAAVIHEKREIFDFALPADMASLFNQLADLSDTCSPTSSAKPSAGQPTPALEDLPAFRALADQIDWAGMAPALARADLSALSGPLRQAFLDLVAMPEVQDLAASRQIAPEILLLGLLARSAASRGNRHANRIAGQLLGRNADGLGLAPA